MTAEPRRIESTRMKILIAPDKFKGTLNAREVAQNIAKGLLDLASSGDPLQVDGSAGEVACPDADQVQDRDRDAV